METTAEKKRSLSFIKAVRVTLPVAVKALPFTWFFYLVMAVTHGAMWGVVAPVNQRLYDALANLAYGEGLLRHVYTGAAAVAGVMLLQQVLNGLHNYMGSQVLNQKMDTKVFHPRLLAKLGRLPAQAFEDNKFLDDTEKAGQACWQIPHVLMTLNDIMFFYGSYFIVMGTFLWGMRPLLLVALAMIFVPVALRQIAETRIWDKLERESAPIRRRFTHYESALTSRDMSKETRLYGVFFFFRRLYMEALGLLQDKEWSVHKQITAIIFALNMVKAAGWVGVMLLLFTSMLDGYITVGAFAAVFGSIGMMFGLLEEVFGRISRSISNNLGNTHNFIDVLEKEEFAPKAEHAAAPDFSRGIEAVDVRFTYPKMDKPAVDGVSLHIRYGETLALVGENGSGKTTLVKLLMGLFKPEGGTVSIGGCDAAITPEPMLFSQTSAVFQDYQRYVFTLAENVYISDYAAGGEMADTLVERKNERGDTIPTMEITYANDDNVRRNAEEKLIAAGVDIRDTATFPHGLDTILSRDLGGVELSGGQWQRIAMARGMYRAHRFIVLDEPTAAIDPLEETRLYKQFTEYSHDKTALLVTHRLGSARIADRILVMDGGKIVEEGTHDTLINANGKYREMWDAQAQRYE
jgi:ATP-binding cassette subfamily B protein